MKKKVVINESITRHIFYAKRSRMHVMALCGFAFFVFVAVLGYVSYTYSCGNASAPCQVPFYPYQG